MYWEVIKRQTKTRMYIDTIKTFKFDEETKDAMYNQALNYAKWRNKLGITKKYYYEIEFDWK
ncbi:hypothetical protein [Clostridium sp. BJN0013]|uniref:hypothetical protein n=1 Tax=Clostridium sp. BJN0013 TaxID=3236840 RepID=UPI0034C601CF